MRTLTMTRTVLAVALLSAACARDPVAPAGPAGIERPGIRAARARFNLDKYSDDGSRPTMGSSGVATVQAEALIGDGGITVLEVYSFQGNNLTRPAGDIDSMELQVFSPQGALKLSRAYPDNKVGNSFLEAYAGLADGDYFVIVAVVSGLAKRIADIVTVTPVEIRRRPDLRVNGIAATALVAGPPMVITADIVELNGERGARTDCLLEIDGVEVDRARNIWVDAGDVVTCAFSYAFLADGVRRLGIRLAKTRPGDDFFDNDTLSVLATVAAPPAPGTPGLPTTTYEAQVRSGLFTSVDSGSSTWTEAVTGRLLLDSRYLTESSGKDESVTMSGVLNTALTLPLAQLEVRLSTDYAMVHTAKLFTIPADAPGGQCFTRDLSGAWFYLCVDPAGFTTWSYVRSGGTVIYQSRGFSTAWNGTSYDTDTWVDNDVFDNGPDIARIGDDLTIHVQLTIGDDYHVTSAAVPLSASTDIDGNPWLCLPGTITLVDGTTAITSDCTFSSYQFIGVAGSAQGESTIIRN